MRLAKSEEQIMGYLWKLEKAYLKNILDEFPDPKPAATTVATVLKRMTDKGFIAFQQHGSNREYFPLIKKTEYFSKQMNAVIKNYFNDSASQFASFVTNETNMSPEELTELRDLVDKQIALKRIKK
jgi:BlaI family transcriptional regulator, penicillinase repressor